MDKKVKNFQDTINWYNKNADYYANAIKDMTSLEEIEEYCRQLPLRAKILDAGCAAGRDANIFKQMGFGVIGIDLSSKLLEIAKRNFPDIEFRKADFRKLPFQNGSFDGVWAHASLVHLENIKDVRKSLLEFNRVLKTNGLIYILVKARIGKAKTAIVKDSLSQDYRFFQYFTKNELTKLLGSTGFKIIKIDQYNERDKNPKGRREVEWISLLAKKISI